MQPPRRRVRTADGYTDFRIAIPSGSRSVALKIYAANDVAGQHWTLNNVVLDAVPTQSNSRWWDGDGSGPVGGGSGLGQLLGAAKRWASAANGTTYAAWNAVNGDNACFTGAGRTVTIAAQTTVAARSLTFDRLRLHDPPATPYRNWRSPTAAPAGREPTRSK